MKVIVVGAGIIGIINSLYLVDAGYDVTLIESNPHIAHNASFQHGSQLSFSHFIPFSHSANLKCILKALYKKDHYIQSDKYSLSILIQLIFNSITHKHNKIVPDLAKFCASSQKEFSKILEKYSDKIQNINSNLNGIIHLFRSEKRFNYLKKLLTNLNSHKKIIDYSIIDKTKLRQIESNINHDNVAGAILFPNDCCIDTYQFCHMIIDILSKKSNFILKLNETITSLEINKKNSITHINSNKNKYQTDYLIIAAGSNSNQILQQLNMQLSLVSVKGYSFSVDKNNLINNQLSINHGLIDVERKIVYSPLNNQLRIAGGFEINNHNKSINHNVINNLIKNIDNILPNLYNKLSSKYTNNLWYGFRSLSLTGKPFIGPDKKYKNLILNTGHGHLGWTMAHVAGKVITDFITANN